MRYNMYIATFERGRKQRVIHSVSLDQNAMGKKNTREAECLGEDTRLVCITGL
jgi:hypothetical protein